MKKQDFSNSNIQELLTALDKIPCMENYQELGFTLKSLGKIAQTALLMEISFPDHAEHDRWDMYNLIKLIQALIPQTEWQILDKIKEQE